MIGEVLNDGDCYCQINREEYYKTKQQLMEILQNCELVELHLVDPLFSFFFSPVDRELVVDFLEVLAETAKNASRLIIRFDYDPDYAIFYEFYEKLHYLDCLIFLNSESHCLPTYPAYICVDGSNYGLFGDDWSKFAFPKYKLFLEDLIRKLMNQCLSNFCIKNDVEYSPFVEFKEFLLV